MRKSNKTGVNTKDFILFSLPWNIVLFLKHIQRNRIYCYHKLQRDRLTLTKSPGGNKVTWREEGIQFLLFITGSNTTQQNWKSDQPDLGMLTSPPTTPTHSREENWKYKKQYNYEKQFKISVSSFHLIIEKFGLIKVSPQYTCTDFNFRLKYFQKSEN